MLALLILFAGFHIQEGTISYYSNVECPGKTASGEQFDDRQMTVAMKGVPFGTRVTFIANGKAVTCRVNDRGPNVKGRVADLSKAAMKKLGGDGLIKGATIIYWKGFDDGDKNLRIQGRERLVCAGGRESSGGRGRVRQHSTRSHR